MARGINKVIIVGNLGNDPETRTFPDGGAITNISVATSEKWTDKQTGQDQERTEWHRIVFRGRLAEIAAQYLHKGSKVYIEGSLRTTKYQDKQTGQDRYSTDIMAREMQMLDTRSDGAAPGQQPQQPQQGYQPQPVYQQQPVQQPAQQNYQQQQQSHAQAHVQQPVQQRPVQQPQQQGNVYQQSNGGGGFNDFDDDIPFSNYELKYI